MTLILAAIALIIQFLPQILSAAGVISPAIANLIQQLGAVVPGLVTGLAAGKGVPDDVIELLQAFQSEIQVLQKDSNLDPTALQQADTLNGAITDALAAYRQAQTVCDPSNLKPLPTDLSPAS